MPSFDVVSQVDWHEVTNAVDQTNREVGNRFDFKNSDARVEQTEKNLMIYADDEYRIGQVRDILEVRLSKRGIDIDCLAAGEIRDSGGGKAQQDLVVRAGVDGECARNLVKAIKASKLKVQTSIQADQVRVSGKKRDILQSVIALLDDQKVGLPLQYVNFRD